MPRVDGIDRDDPSMGRPRQRLVRRRGGVRLGDRHLRLRLRHPSERNKLNGLKEKPTTQWRPDLLRPQHASPRRLPIVAPSGYLEKSPPYTGRRAAPVAK